MRAENEIKQALKLLKEIKDLSRGRIITPYDQGGISMLEWVLGKEFEPESKAE